MEERIIIYCDGGSRGNPGPAASAFIVAKNGVVIDQGSKYLGIDTNNAAEYMAVLLAMKWIDQNILTISHQSLVVNVDSQLIQRQLTGVYKIKSENLRGYFLQIKNLEKSLDLNITFNWSYRDKNKLADDLVNKSLDDQLQRERKRFTH